MDSEEVVVGIGFVAAILTLLAAFLQYFGVIDVIDVRFLEPEPTQQVRQIERPREPVKVREVVDSPDRKVRGLTGVNVDPKRTRKNLPPAATIEGLNGLSVNPDDYEQVS